jgi:hypothetical protein
MSSANTALSSSQALLMGIFALHNLEEIISIRREAALYESHLSALGIDRSWYRQDRMVLATGLLTALSHGLSRNIDHPANTRQAQVPVAMQVLRSVKKARSVDRTSGGGGSSHRQRPGPATDCSCPHRRP